MGLKQDVIQFAGAVGLLFPLGGGVLYIGNMSNAIAGAQETADAAITRAQQALEATQGIDVIQEQIRSQKREIDEVQQHLTTTRDELNRKLDRLLDLELNRRQVLPR